MASYYSEKVSGPPSRTETDFTERSWGGIVALVERSIANNAFADAFPEQCPDGRGVSATDERGLRLAVLGEHPRISWPLDPTTVPKAPEALDLLEFLHEFASAPAPKDYHAYFGHYHLSFDRLEGQRAFREQVNRILGRNGLAYEFQQDGRARRLLEPPLEEALREGLPLSGDDKMDALIAQAEQRFLDPDPAVAHDALEKLWDSFERVKTLVNPDKKTGATALVASATSTKPSAELVLAETRTLTDIGNAFHIRHHETTRHPVPNELVDYLFIRMYTLLRLLIGGLKPDEVRP